MNQAELLDRVYKFHGDLKKVSLLNINDSKIHHVEPHEFSHVEMALFVEVYDLKMFHHFQDVDKIEDHDDLLLDELYGSSFLYQLIQLIFFHTMFFSLKNEILVK